VCEKEAALEAVHKRLRAEGLGSRVVRIENPQSDRTRLLRELQTQVPEIHRIPPETTSELKTRRREAAARVDHFERSLSDYHTAIHAPGSIGLSYRQIVTRIAALEQETLGLTAPDLREVLGRLSPAELEGLVAECAGVFDIWRDANFMDPALAAFSVFSCDPAVRERISDEFKIIATEEGKRRQELSQHGPFVGLSLDVSVTALTTWLQLVGSRVRHVRDIVRIKAAAWAPLTDIRPDGSSIAMMQRDTLGQMSDTARGIQPLDSEQAVYEQISVIDRGLLKVLANGLAYLSDSRSFLQRLNPVAVLIRGRVRKVLRSLGLPTNRETVEAACSCASKERSLRALRSQYEAIARQFGEAVDAGAASALDLATQAAQLRSAIQEVIAFAADLSSCPWPDPLREALTQTEEGWRLPFLRLESAARHITAAKIIEERLSGLAGWLDRTWASEREKNIQDLAPLRFDPDALVSALPHLDAFQTFRQSPLSDRARTVFLALSRLQPTLARLGSSARDAVIALLRREVAFAWADQLRHQQPVLSKPPQALSQEIEGLKTAESEMRAANRRLLAHVPADGVDKVGSWAQIWTISGRRTLKLREFFTEGRRRGLLRIRPIWLVSSDVASRIFPPEPDLFDVAIFDEASQTRVENALAAVYRAKRVIISGDSKQLPPTRFFGVSVDDDDDEDDIIDSGVNSEDADAEGGYHQQQNVTLNRRHIKDCPDLLALSQGVLSERSLTIHYRSAYRELIAFSNSAFYGGGLSVPASHPSTAILRHRPIELRNVNGVYQSQINPKEAKAVVDYLADIWLNGISSPTIGVVTFNLKQAELIDEQLDARARTDRDFRAALDRERSRSEDGEDVSFFVRNLENVQGDERDHIIFSTTFGPDGNDVFRRNYGALSKDGGERRLNVAVTRAKSKVTVITSLEISQVSDFLGRQRMPSKARDFFQGYLRYAELISEGDGAGAARLLQTFELASTSVLLTDPEAASDAFVNHIQTVLNKEGLQTVLRPTSGAFAVDLAVIHPQTGTYCLGLEIDGPRHQLLSSARARELWRPRILERQGMRVHRIWTPAWANDPERERRLLLETTRRTIQGDQT